MKIKITSDSTCDLSPEQIARYDIAILPLAVAMGGRDYHDGVDLTPSAIYAHVDAGGDLPQTAANNVARYHEFWAQFREDYDAIIIYRSKSEYRLLSESYLHKSHGVDHVM